MAVSPIELRPRSAAALMDAGVRLCMHSSGVWLLVLPGVLAVTAALQLAQDALETGVLGPAAMALSLAWVLRALGQGAAAHHLRGLLLEERPPVLKASIRAALHRAPSLIFAATWLAAWRAMLALMTLGTSFLLGGSGSVAYAAAMQRQGSVLKLGGEARAMLGSSRGKALAAQFLFGFQLVAALNLHLLVATLIGLSRSLLALDVAWLAELTSISNPDWFLLLVAVIFGAFEPLRAAVATLLLLDARVRRDGVDLVARLEALPNRRRIPPRADAALWLVLALAPLLGASSAAAQAPWRPASEATSPPVDGGPTAGSDPRQDAPPAFIGGSKEAEPTWLLEAKLERLTRLASRCGAPDAFGPEDARALGALPFAERGAMARWITRLEDQATDPAGCERALQALRRDLPLLRDTLQAAPPDETDARLAAILARPEFLRQVKQEQEALPEGFTARLDAAWSRFTEWLSRLFEDEEEERPRDVVPPRNASGEGLALANGLYVALIACCVLIVAVVLFRVARGLKRERSRPSTGEVSVTPLLDQREVSALARAPATWLSLADELAARGLHREALRHLYLALLSGLHARGAIQYDPHKSNWDHLLGFKGPAQQRVVFRELTLRFDFAWYGEAPVAPEGWSAFRDLALSLLPHPEGARHA